GATVVAVHEPSGTRYGAATRTDGRYDLRGLRVGGPYTVTASFIGYRGATQSGLTLSLGQTQTVDFALAEDVAELGEVEVMAEGTGAVIAATRTGAATNVSEEAIEALPTISRSLADFARLSPLSAGLLLHRRAEQPVQQHPGRDGRHRHLRLRRLPVRRGPLLRPHRRGRQHPRDREALRVRRHRVP